MDERELKGLEIAKIDGQIERVDDNIYRVKSQSGNGDYCISNMNNKWVCTCPDFVKRGLACKHIHAVQFSIALRAEVVKRIKPIEGLTNCIFCNSANIVRDGIRRNKFVEIQKFFCRDCQHYFSFNVGFEKMKHDPHAITVAMQLYFSGESLRNTMRSLKLIGVEVSHQTVYNWIKKYSNLLRDYVEKIKPNVSGVWRADEMWIKVKGDMKYLFALIDDETRYWIAQEVAESKYKHDAKSVFMQARKNAGKRPRTVITDGLPSYHDAFNKVFFTIKNPRAKHISTIRWRGDMENNKMERFNGEVRGREKVMRGLKRTDTPILTGYQIFHNYMRPHEALNGRTPAEACGIEVEGNNKWLTLIQNAGQPTKIYKEVNPTES